MMNNEPWAFSEHFAGRLLSEGVGLLGRKSHQEVILVLVVRYVFLELSKILIWILPRFWSGFKSKQNIFFTLMSSMAWDTLILLMAASRLNCSTMIRCCCKLLSWNKGKRKWVRSWKIGAQNQHLKRNVSVGVGNKKTGRLNTKMMQVGWISHDWDSKFSL